MTAIQPSFDSAATVDPNRWVAVVEAADRLKLNPGHLARLCRGELSGREMAMIATPADGGQNQWFIRRDYDARLIGGTLGDLHVEPDLSRFTEKQRRMALARRACVLALRELRRSSPGLMKDAIVPLIARLRDQYKLPSLGARALYKWEKRYSRPSDLEKLIDARGGNRRGQDDPAAWQAFRGLYLHQNRPSIAQCHAAVNRLAAENNWKWCSLRSCQQQLDRRIPIEVQLQHREPAAWRTKMAPFIAQSPESWRANELWIGDHKQLDLICWWEQSKIRPWLTTWMDWRTRKIVGYVLSDNPNSTTILGALRHGLKEPANCGGPRCVWIDNGKDYDAWLFHGQTKKERRATIMPAVDEPKAFGIFAMLKIEAHFATPYNPNGKARLERWFRTLESFCKTFATYTGDGPDTRPERLNQILENPRSIPTFKEVQLRIADHIAGYNERSDHAIDDLTDAGERISPNEAMNRWCDTRRVIDEKSLELLMVNWHKPVTVGRNGIALALAGESLHYGQYCPELRRFKARFKADRMPVIVAYDPENLQTIRVHDEQFRFICEAPMNQIGGAHGNAIAMKHVAEMNRQKATYNKAEKSVAELSITRILTNEELASSIAAKQSSERRPAPTSLQIVNTPMDGQAEEIDRGRLRKAVGDGTPPPSNTRRGSFMDKLMQTQRPRNAATATTRSTNPWGKATQLREADKHG